MSKSAPSLGLGGQKSLLNLEAIKCYSNNFKVEDFQNCEILQDKIKAEMIRYCLEQRLIELKNCSDEFDKERKTLDDTKVGKAPGLSE